MVVEIPLTDDEQAAVHDDRRAVRQLLDRLADTPTPGGPTLRDRTHQPTGPHPPRPGSGDYE